MHFLLCIGLHDALPHLQLITSQNSTVFCCLGERQLNETTSKKRVDEGNNSKDYCFKRTVFKRTVLLCHEIRQLFVYYVLELL